MTPTAHGASITNTTIATPTENFSPASLPPSKSADNAAMSGSTRKSTTQNDITMDNLIAKTILQQIGGHRFVAMTGSHDFINLGNGLRMSLSRNKTSANRLVIDLWSLCFAKKSSMTRAQTSTTCVFTASP